MRIVKHKLKINANGQLVIWKNNRWELTSRAWQWDDITAGYIRESKRNHKKASN